MGVLREISRLPDAIHRLTSTLRALAETQRESAPLEARVEELERDRAMWEAEMEAAYLKADSKYKAAANAESRTRKQLEKLDPFGSEGEEVPEGIPPEYAEVSEAEGMHPMHLDVAPPNSKALALRMKYL